MTEAEERARRVSDFLVREGCQDTYALLLVQFQQAISQAEARTLAAAASATACEHCRAGNKLRDGKHRYFGDGGLGGGDAEWDCPKQNIRNLQPSSDALKKEIEEALVERDGEWTEAIWGGHPSIHDPADAGRLMEKLLRKVAERVRETHPMMPNDAELDRIVEEALGGKRE